MSFGSSSPASMMALMAPAARGSLQQKTPSGRGLSSSRRRIALGIYLWDYASKDPAKAEDNTYVMGHPVPLELMEHQCGLGLKWLREGRVSDLVILGLAGIDQGIPSAPWMSDWIRKHGDEKLNR